jgi:hypothetical protein
MMVDLNSKTDKVVMTGKVKNQVLRVALATVVMLLMGAGIWAQDTRSNYMPGTDFSKYKTYKWVNIEGGSHPNQIVDAQIKQSVDSQLTSKGLTKTDSDNADLYVGYQISVDQEKQWNAYGMGGGFRFGGMATAQSTTISVGTLVLDMYDRSAKQLVWTGSATKTVDPGKSQEKNQQNLNKAMQKVLKNYPPK